MMEEKDEFLDYCDSNPLEPFEDDEFDSVDKVSLFIKSGMLASLELRINYDDEAEYGGAIIRTDPRTDKPAIALYDEAREARRYYAKSVKSTLKNGWKLVNLDRPELRANYDKN